MRMGHGGREGVRGERKKGVGAWEEGRDDRVDVCAGERRGAIEMERRRKGEQARAIEERESKGKAERENIE